MTKVKIVEVGPRDGLQNEAKHLSVDDKVALIQGLAEAGLQDIEVGSLVSPKWVPQMANSDEVYQKAVALGLDAEKLHMLVPNARGLARAQTIDVKTIAVFVAASDSFSEKNINCTVQESIEGIRPVVIEALEAGIRVRGYVSCVIGCPYEGWVDSAKVVPVVEALFDMGCYELSLGDTIGVATVQRMGNLLDDITASVSSDRLALHLHDTYGQALLNVLLGLEKGVRVFDSSVAGLGGCPYAEGATGNVATEDLLYMLQGYGCELDGAIDTDKLIEVGEGIRKVVASDGSKVAKATLRSKTRFFPKSI